MSLTIRPAPPLGSYPALPRTTDLDLIPIVRVEYCACGVYVHQLAGDSLLVTVSRHNATVTHRAWRLRDDE